MKKGLRNIAALLLLCLFNVAIATPLTPAERARASQAPTNDIDFSELDKLIPGELKERNTPGAVIAIVIFADRRRLSATDQRSSA